MGKRYQDNIDGLLDALGDYMNRSEITEIKCKFCGSTEIVKNGHRKGRQYWLCKRCGKGFVDNKAIPGMRYPTENIGSALWQFYCGSSLNDIRGYIEQHTGNRPSDSSIFGWVKRFTEIALEETEKHTPQVGDVWIADETVVKIGGKNWWLWDIIDSETRFLLATHLSPTRMTKDTQELMKQAAEKAGKAPKQVITDKLASCLDGIELEFGADAKHRQGGPFNVENNTNLIERFHGTLKDRLKVMRGLKSPETADFLIKGWLVFYNYIRPHESLDDRTPAEVAKVTLPFKNWLEVAKSEEPKLEIPKGVYTPYRVRKPRVRSAPKRTTRRTRSDAPTMVRGIRL
jgi:putative transposase